MNIRFPQYKAPARFVYTGDEQAAKIYKGFGLKRYNMLLESMKPNNLKSHKSEVKLDNGIVIRTSEVHGIGTVHIDAPITGGEEIETVRECFCNCSFTVGVVTDAYDNEDGDLRYIDVLACRGKKSYVEYKYLRASDFTPWEVGMVVVLIPFYGHYFKCDISDEGDYKGCSPYDSNAYPSGRAQNLLIIPICCYGGFFPKWRDVVVQ